MEESLGKHLGSQAAGFLNKVFSLHDKETIQQLFSKAGFGNANIQTGTKPLTLPPAEDFLWQYIYGTPLAALAAGASEESCLALEKEMTGKWQNYSENGGTKDGQPMVTVITKK